MKLSILMKRGFSLALIAALCLVAAISLSGCGGGIDVRGQVYRLAELQGEIDGKTDLFAVLNDELSDKDKEYIENNLGVKIDEAFYFSTDGETVYYSEEYSNFKDASSEEEIAAAGIAGTYTQNGSAVTVTLPDKTIEFETADKFDYHDGNDFGDWLVGPDAGTMKGKNKEGNEITAEKIRLCYLSYATPMVADID